MALSDAGPQSIIEVCTTSSMSRRCFKASQNNFIERIQAAGNDPGTI
jgi:hypothetical protein